MGRPGYDAVADQRLGRRLVLPEVWSPHLWAHPDSPPTRARDQADLRVLQATQEDKGQEVSAVLLSRPRECKEPAPRTGFRCSLPRGHRGYHAARYDYDAVENWPRVPPSVESEKESA